MNGDGEITLPTARSSAARTRTSPAGWTSDYRRGNWDLSATVFGSFGNNIFENQKEFYVFRDFSTNVRKDLLANSWTPTNPNAKYPRLDVSDTYSHAISSYYVKDGSYIRLRNLQLGYNVPPVAVALAVGDASLRAGGEPVHHHRLRRVSIRRCPRRTSPAPAGDIRDQYRGIDRGVVSEQSECSASASSPRSDIRLFKERADDENRIEAPAARRDGADVAGRGSCTGARIS